MHKLIIFISCLVCLAAAGRLGLDRKLSWLENWRHGGHDNQMINGRILNNNAMTPNQRQQFLLDVLLQVQRPVVNGDIIEMGKILIHEPEMYTEPHDDILLEFLQQARNQELLCRNDIYNELNAQHLRQLVGLYRFLVLARDWSTFQRNTCYARMRVNPVMLVNALMLATRDRVDTQDLIMPAINEILPQLFYGRDVIESAQNADWNSLVSQTTTRTNKPHLLDLLGLRNLSLMRPGLMIHMGKTGIWNPWQEWRMGKVHGGPRVGQWQHMTPNNVLTGSGLSVGQEIVGDNMVVNENKILVDMQEKVVIQVQGQQSGISQVSTLSDDVGLNIFWNSLMTEHLMQAQINGKSLNAIGPCNPVQINEVVGSTLWNTGMNNVEDAIIAQNTWQAMAEHQNQKRHTNRIGRVGLSVDNTGVWQLQNAQRDITDDMLQAGQQRNTDCVQGCHGNNDICCNQQSGTGQRNQDRSGNRGVNDIWSSQQNDKINSKWNRGQTLNTNNLPYADVNSQRLLHVNRHRLNELNSNSQLWNEDIGNLNAENQKRLLQQQVNDDADQQGQRWTNAGRGRVSVNDDAITRRNTWNIGQNDWENTNRVSQPMRSRVGQGVEQGRSNMQLNQQENMGMWQRSKANHEQGWLPRNEYQQTITGNWPIIDGDRLMGGRDNFDNAGQQISWWNERQTNGRQQVVDDVTDQRRARGINTIDISPTDELKNLRNSEMLIQNLQQLVARLNIENIALVEDNLAAVQGQQWKQQQMQEELLMQQTTQNVVQEIKSTIDILLQRNQISRYSDQVLQVIGEVLSGACLGQQQNVWQIINTQINRNGLSSLGPISINNLRQTLNQQVIVELVQLINQYVQQLQPYNAEDLVANDIAVNGVDVDRLITYTETVDTDLINLVDQQLLQSNLNNLQKLQKKVVAREQRLNHEPFSITYNIASQRNQRVVVRTFLGPKVGANGLPIPFNQNRQNFILLNAFVKNLEAGNNMIVLNSRDIACTTRDVSTLSQIYRSVMMTGQQSIQQLVGSNCNFPQRLLLPRGTINGLHMQLLVVVTPVTAEDRVLQELINPEHLCGLGIAGINLDRLPLGFPLDREIVNLQQVTVPNMLMKTVVIQHDNQVRVNRS